MASCLARLPGRLPRSACFAVHHHHSQRKISVGSCHLRLASLWQAKPLESARRMHTTVSVSPHVKPDQSSGKTFRSRKKFSGGSVTLIILGLLGLGYSLGNLYPIPNVNIYRSIIKHFLIPSYQGRIESNQQFGIDDQALEDQLEHLEIVKKLKEQPDIWQSIRPFKNVDPGLAAHSLTLGSLKGVGKFAILPLVFINSDETEAITIVHAGKSLCGFEGIIHGGLSATICDEGLAALALLNLPSRIGVTASLKLDYKKPITSNQFLVLKSKLKRNSDENTIKKLESDELKKGDDEENHLSKQKKSRKVWVEGSLENLAGDVLVSTEGLFIEPRHAKFLNKSLVENFLGDGYVHHQNRA